MRKNPDQITARLYYRGLTNGTYKSTKILRVTFPYKTEDFYYNKDLAYSDQADMEELKLAPDSMTLKHIDNQLSIFEGSEVEGRFRLKDLRTTIHMKPVSTKRSNSFSPEIQKLELYFEDGTTIHHILIDTSMFAKEKTAVYWAPLILLSGIVLTGGSSITIAEKLKKFAHDKDWKDVAPLGMVVTDLMFVVTGFVFMKFLDNFNSCILIGIIVLLVFVFKALETVPWISNLGSLRLRTKLWLFVIIMVNLAWMVLLYFEFRIILRGFLMFSWFVLVDLFYLDVSKVQHTASYLKLWLLVTVPGLANQLMFWSLYTMAFWDTHRSLPSLLLSYVLPDLFLFLVLLFPFFLKFKINTKSKAIMKKQVTNKVEAKVPEVVLKKETQVLKPLAKCAVNTLRKELSKQANQRQTMSPVLRQAPSLLDYKKSESMRPIKESSDVVVINLFEENRVGKAGAKLDDLERSSGNKKGSVRKTNAIELMKEPHV